MLVEICVLLAKTDAMPTSYPVVASPPVDWDRLEARARSVIRSQWRDDGDIAYRRVIIMAEVGEPIRYLPDVIKGSAYDVEGPYLLRQDDD